MPRVVLPVEIKVRELIGKLWLALNLVQKDGRVALGPTSPVYRSLDRLEPDLYFTMSAVNRDSRRNRITKLSNCGTKIAVLDTEGSAFGGSKQYMPRVSPEILSRVDYFFAWGTESAEIAGESGGPNIDKKISIAGNPRFDVLEEDLRCLYLPRAEQIRDRFGRYTLFNTNFSVNHVDPEKMKQMATNDLSQLYRTQTKLVGEFLSVVATLSGRLPDRTVVIRPHPNEALHLYEKLFRAFDNVVVEREGDVRPWILGSDAVVHNSCTTGVAAAMLGTPVFAYMPDGAGVHESPIPNVVSERIEDGEELVDRIERLSPDERYQMDDKQTRKLKQHIANVDFRSTDRIVSALQPVLDGNISTGGFESEFDPDPKIRVHRGLVRTLGHNPFVEQYRKLTGDNRERYKFDELDRTELINLIDRFPDDEVPSGIEVTPVEYAEDTYWIHT